MKLLFDTSVWIEHLRHAALTPLLSAIRGRLVLCLDAIVAAELRAGCRSKGERRVVAGLCAPHERTGRLLCPTANDFEAAALALSKLRERGRPISGGKAGLLDALIVQLAAREGALLITHNLGDFGALASQIPARVESFEAFAQRFS